MVVVEDPEKNQFPETDAEARKRLRAKLTRCLSDGMPDELRRAASNAIFHGDLVEMKRVALALDARQSRRLGRQFKAEHDAIERTRRG